MNQMEKLQEEIVRKSIRLGKKVAEVSKGNLVVNIDGTQKDRTQISVQNIKSNCAISLKNVWNDDSIDRVDEAIAELEKDVASSIENDYGMPKPSHKPMFTVEELYLAIAEENN